MPKCTSDASCQSYEVCSPNGSCGPRACDAGFACASGEVCDPSAASVEAHGCRALNCDEAGGAACGPNYVCAADRGAGNRHCALKLCAIGADCDCGACELSASVRVCVDQVSVCGPAF